MNALNVIQELRQTISTEIKTAEEVLLLCQTTLAGSVYINNGRSMSPYLELTMAAVNELLIDYCKLNLGFALAVELRRLRTDPFIKIFDINNKTKELTASDFLDHYIELFKVDESFFEKLLAHTLFLEIVKNDGRAGKSPDGIDSLVSKVKFNNIKMTCLSWSSGKSFYCYKERVLGVIILINNICSKSNIISSNDIKQANSQLLNLDPYKKDFSSCVIDGIEVIAYKGGHIKISLNKEIAETLEQKVKPFIGRDYFL